jgi:exopolyphosphatase/guanosine-5'-triphosphate,3'-diphosphate pyrophosphatase
MTKVKTLEEQYPEVMKGRAEVILAGILILDEFMNFYGIPEVKVSTGGIRHGAILQENKKEDTL